MTNGIEQDVRDLRQQVTAVLKDGCGHRIAVDKAIDVLHLRIDGERRERITEMKTLMCKLDRIYWISLVAAGGIITMLARALLQFLFRMATP